MSSFSPEALTRIRERQYRNCQRMRAAMNGRRETIRKVIRREQAKAQPDMQKVTAYLGRLGLIKQRLAALKN